MSKTILIDTCIWFELLDEDENAISLFDTIREDNWNIIFPYPCLYETINTRLTRQKAKLFQLEKLLKSPKINIFDDVPYRETAINEVFLKARYGLSYSLVDCVLREIIKDLNVRMTYMATINKKDFADICALRDVEIISLNKNN